MAYILGDTILATHYNTFIGNPTGGAGSDKMLVPFASAAEAQNTAAGIMGVGFGDRGYGQTTPSLTAVISGNTITSTQWTNFRTAISTASSHQGTATTLLPPASELAVGQLIEAHEADAPTSDPYDFGTMLTSIDTNRLNTDGGLSLDSSLSAHTVTRATAWSASIISTVTATWANENATRYFFNSGGYIRVRFNHPNGVSTQDDAWRTIIAGIGNYDLAANAASRSGTLGTIVGPAGYYGMSATSATSFDGTDIGTGAYATNDVTIAIRYSAGTTTNGAKGNQIEFIITLNDQHTGPVDTVASGTQAIFDVFYAGASSPLSGIATPSWSTVVGF